MAATSRGTSSLTRSPRRSTFRKIRLAYALKYRTHGDADSIVYQVRNGKSFATEFHFDYPENAQEALRVVTESIVSDMRKKVDGKSIYIPDWGVLRLASYREAVQRQPARRYLRGDQGRHGDGHPLGEPASCSYDLDLSLQSVAGKVGMGRGLPPVSGRDVLFSGDVVDAPLPGGASEFFSISAEARGVWLMSLNYFNFHADIPVPFQILVAEQAQRSLTLNYTLDPNLVKASAASQIDVKQKNIGRIVADQESTRFDFSESAMGGGRSARATKHATQARDFMLRRFDDTLSLNDVLVSAGVNGRQPE